MLELLRRSKHRKLQQGKVDLSHDMPRPFRAFSIRESQGPAESVGRGVGMADNNKYTA